MAQVKSIIGVKRAFEDTSENIQDHYEYLPDLLADFPMEVALAYCFARLEYAQNMALYCGVVKIHHANAEVARDIISVHRMTREKFLKLYHTVFGFEPPGTARDALKTAEDARDDVMHGKPATAERLRNALVNVLEYSDAMHRQLTNRVELSPFGDLRGFSGRAKKYEPEATRFMLKGMGFAVS